MLHQGVFDFDGGHPQATDLKHVIRAPAVPIIAFGVAVVSVAGLEPLPLHHFFCLFVLVPLIGRIGVALDHEIANLADRNLVSFVVDYLCFKGRCHFAAASRLGSSRPIGKKIMSCLRGADHVQKLDAEAILPLMKQSRRQRLAGGKADSERAQVVGLFYTQQASIEGGNGEEKGRMILVDNLENLLWFGSLGPKNCCRAKTKRKIKGIAEPVSKEQFGSREANIILVHS